MKIGEFPVSSGDDARWRPTIAAKSGLMVKTVPGIVACSENACENFLVSILSWTFAQFLEGCAAYGKAMYPGFVGVTEPVDQRNPARGVQSEQENSNQLQSQTSGSSEISSIETDEITGTKVKSSLDI
jgi:hypothetical protein